MDVPTEYMIISNQRVTLLFPSNSQQLNTILDQTDALVVIAHALPKAILYDFLELAVVIHRQYCIVDLLKDDFLDLFNSSNLEMPHILYYKYGVRMPVPKYIYTVFSRAAELILS